MIPETDRYLKIDSLPLAAYLFAKGGELVSVALQGNRGFYTFVRTPDVEMWQGEFKEAPAALVDARMYFNALRTLQTERQEEKMKSNAREDPTSP